MRQGIVCQHHDARTVVLARELMWLMSAATPGVAAISYSDSSLTNGEICCSSAS